MIIIKIMKIIKINIKNYYKLIKKKEQNHIINQNNFKIKLINMKIIINLIF